MRPRASLAIEAYMPQGMGWGPGAPKGRRALHGAIQRAEFGN